MHLYDKKMNIYEVHAGSWKRKDFSSIENVVEREKMETYTYRELAEELIPYVKKMGYSHIEFHITENHQNKPTQSYLLQNVPEPYLKSHQSHFGDIDR